MTQTHSKARQQAEIAFGNTQAHLFARSHGVEEHDATVQAREEKTVRLREARKAKELSELEAATAGLLARRSARG